MLCPCCSDDMVVARATDQGEDYCRRCKKELDEMTPKNSCLSAQLSLEDVMFFYAPEVIINDEIKS